MKKGRIKRVTITYYLLSGEVSHSEVEFYPQVKYPIIGWITGAFGWPTFEGAKEALLKKISKKTKDIEYINI